MEFVVAIDLAAAGADVVLTARFLPGATLSSVLVTGARGVGPRPAGAARSSAVGLSKLSLGLRRRRVLVF